jgi:hypothetical protein
LPLTGKRPVYANIKGTGLAQGGPGSREHSWEQLGAGSCSELGARSSELGRSWSCELR